MLAVMAMFVTLAATAANRTKDFTVNGMFNGISADNNIEVVYTVSPKAQVKVTAEEASLPHVSVALNNGILTLSTKGEVKGKVVARVSGPALASIAVSGNAEFKTRDGINAEALTVKASGNAEIDLAGVMCGRLTAQSEGNSEVNLGDVVCDELAATAHGNSSIDMSSASGTRLTVVSEGNSEAEIDNAHFATAELTSNGNSTIEIDGNAGIARLTSNGNSSIKARELTVNSGSAAANGVSSIVCKKGVYDVNVSLTGSVRQM